MNKTLLIAAFLGLLNLQITAMDVGGDGNAYGPDWQPEQFTAAQLQEIYEQNAITLRNKRAAARQAARLEREAARLANPQPPCARNLFQEWQQGEQQ